MASNPYSRDSTRTWSTRSCVEQFGIYKEAPVKPYNYYKNNSRFIRTGVVAVMLAIVALLVFLMITDISKTNGAVRSREKDAFLRLLSASQENNNNHTSTPTPSTSTSTPRIVPTTSTPPSPAKTSPTQPSTTAKDAHLTNHNTAEDFPTLHFDFHDDTNDYDWSEPSDEEIPSRELADRKLHELQRLKPPPNRRNDAQDHDIHIHVPTGPRYATPSRAGDRPAPASGHRVYQSPDGVEHHEISFRDVPAKAAPGGLHRDIPLHWGQGARPPGNVGLAFPPNSAQYPGKGGLAFPPNSAQYPGNVGLASPPNSAQYPGKGGLASPPNSVYYPGKGGLAFPPNSAQYPGNVGLASPPNSAQYPGKGGLASPPNSVYYPGKGGLGSAPNSMHYPGNVGLAFPPNSVYNPGDRGQAFNHRRPEYLERPIVVLDGPQVKLRSQKRPPASEYYEPRQPTKPATDFRVYNHHAHNASTASQPPYPQYWRPYLDDLNHGASKKEPRIVNKNPALGDTATAKPRRKLKTKKPNATRQPSASNKFPQLLNYHYPKDAKNIGDIIKYLNRYEPAQTDDPTPLFDANLGKIMKLKGVYVTHVNDDADANTANGHAYNADPFQAYKPDNMADINYLLPHELRLPTESNQIMFKNTIRHLKEKKRVEQAAKFVPRPPVKYFSNAPMSHQNYNSPVEAYTTAIYHPWSTVAPATQTSTSRPSPMSVMLDVFPLAGGEGKPSRGKRKPFKTITMNVDKEAAATGRKQQMVLHLNLYPRKKQNANSRSDVDGPGTSSLTVNFKSDTHDIAPAVERHYNEDYEGEIRRSDDDYTDADDEDDYDLDADETDASLKRTEAHEREGDEVDFRINVEEDDDFLFADDATTTPPSTKREAADSETVPVESVSEKPPSAGGRTTGGGDRLATRFPAEALDRLDALVGEKRREFASGESGRDASDFGRENVMSVLESEVENRHQINNASRGIPHEKA